MPTRFALVLLIGLCAFGCDGGPEAKNEPPMQVAASGQVQPIRPHVLPDGRKARCPEGMRCGPTDKNPILVDQRRVKRSYERFAMIRDKATAALFAENPQQAEAILRRGLPDPAGYTGSPELRLLLAESLIEQGQASEALSILGRVVVSGGQFGFETDTLTALAYAQIGDLRRARLRLRDKDVAVYLYPKPLPELPSSKTAQGISARARYASGIRHLHHRRFTEAERELRLAQKNAPANRGIAQALADLKRARGF